MIRKPSPAEAVENVRAAMRRSAADRSRAFRRTARAFYPAKLAECETFGALHGFETVAVAGACAAFSPGIDPALDDAILTWLSGIGPDAEPCAANRPADATFGIPYGYANFRQAHAILHGAADPYGVMGENVKRGMYFRAIMGDRFAWVIDVHCWRDMIGAPNPETSTPLAKLTPKQYREYREAFRAAGITAADQAEIWADRRAA